MFVLNFSEGWTDLRETVKASSVPNPTIFAFYGKAKKHELDSATVYASIIKDCVCDNYDKNICIKNVCGFDQDWNWDEYIERYLSIIRKIYKEIKFDLHDEELP